VVTQWVDSDSSGRADELVSLSVKSDGDIRARQVGCLVNGIRSVNVLPVWIMITA
jgi:hypothetical protein